MNTASECDDLQWDPTDLATLVDGQGYHWSMDWFEMTSDVSHLLSFLWIKNKFEDELEKELGWCDNEKQKKEEKADEDEAEKEKEKKKMVEDLQWKNVTQRKKKIPKQI